MYALRRGGKLCIFYMNDPTSRSYDPFGYNEFGL